MSKRWLYVAADPGHLSELNLRLEPGEEFEAPEDWQPEPNPHPSFRPVVPKSAPAQAPE